NLALSAARVNPRSRSTGTPGCVLHSHRDKRLVESGCVKTCSEQIKRRPHPRAPKKLNLYNAPANNLFLRLLFLRWFLSGSCRRWRRCRRLRLRRTSHAFLEPAHPFSQSAHQLRNLAPPEQNKYHDGNNQQMHWAVPHGAPTFHAGFNEPERRGCALHTAKV